MDSHDKIIIGLVWSSFSRW